jgi:hypothetical protein
MMEAVRFLYLCMVLLICQNESFRLPIHNRFGSSKVILAHPKFGRKSTIIRLIDPNAVDTMYQASAVATDSFLNSFVARTVGAIVGNLLSAVVFKYVSDIIFKKNEPEVKQPERVLKTADISQTAWIQLLFCIMIDLGSDASFLIPGIGELEDVAWAPISAYLLNLVFGSSAISTLEFAKEILPGTDILPVATLAWLLQNIFTDSPLTGALGLKKGDPKGSKNVIDVKGESISPDIDAWDDKFKEKR